MAILCVLFCLFCRKLRFNIHFCLQGADMHRQACTLPGGVAGRGDAARCALWRIGAGPSRSPPAAAKHRGGAPAPARWGAHFRTVRQNGVMLSDVPFGEWEQGASRSPPAAAKYRGGASAPARQARTLPGSVPAWGVPQSDASGSSGSSGRPRAVRTARPGRSIARSAADHSSVPSSSTPAAAAPTA